MPADKQDVGDKIQELDNTIIGTIAEIGSATGTDVDITLEAPLILKAPTFWKFSHLKNKEVLVILLIDWFFNTGV